MNNIRFFDSVGNKSFENLFYIEGLSNKLGFKKYQLIDSNSDQLKLSTQKNSHYKWRSCAKILILATLIPIPFALAFKYFYRKQHHFTIESSSVEKNKVSTVSQRIVDFSSVKDSENYLKELCDVYLDPSSEVTVPIKKIDRAIELGSNEKILTRSLINKSADLVIQSNQTNQKAFFIPNTIKVSRERDLTILKKALSSTFATGKEIAVVRLHIEQHAVAAAFSSDGTFKVIDSMSIFGKKYFNTITRELNEAKIKGKNGQPLDFKGELIHTGIQRIDGNECLRISTLYCYHIACKGSLDAYQEVNGAFSNDRIKKFSDLHLINGSPKVKKVDPSKIPYQSYLNFLKSWAFEIYDYAISDWREVPLKDLDIKPLENRYELKFYVLNSKGKGPASFHSFKFQPVYHAKCGVVNPLLNFDDLEQRLQKVNVPLSPEVTLGSLLNYRQKGKVLLLGIGKNNHIGLFYLNHDEEILRKVDDMYYKISALSRG